MKEIVDRPVPAQRLPAGRFQHLPDSFGRGPVARRHSTKYSRRRILRQLPEKLGRDLHYARASRSRRRDARRGDARRRARLGERGRCRCDRGQGTGADPGGARGPHRQPVWPRRGGRTTIRSPAGWDGEEVAGFTVIEFPGHTPGQIGLWRESDRTVICADVMRSMNLVTGFPQLGEMPDLHLRRRGGAPEHPQARGARGRTRSASATAGR